MDNKKTMHRILRLIRPYGLQVVLVIVLAAVTVIATLYAPILIGNGVDCLVGPGEVSRAGIRQTVIRLAVVIAIAAVSQWFLSLLTNRITCQVVRDVREKMFFRLQHLPLSYIDAKQPGDMISRISTDVDQFADGLLMGFTQLFTGVMTIFATLAFMISINVRITLVVVIITPLSFFVAGFISKNTFTMFKLQSETRGELTSLVEEMIGNQKVVKAFSYEDRALERFADVNERLKDCGLKATFFSSITNPSTRFVNGLVYTGVGIYGAFSAIQGRITVGQLSSFLNYANQYTKPFNEISGVIAEFQNALASAGRMFAFIDEEMECADAPDAVELEQADGSITFEHVSFSYHPDLELIRDLNLAVKPGQRVAIVGPTGCGKTTIINLLMRFYDVDDGILRMSGFSVRDLTRNSLRSHYGMVLQDTWLKTGTIMENIAYGKPGATRREVVLAAKKAHAHSFIRRMQDGYDTVISEEGAGLSQGQKQLLCIARVMLLDPTVLILDEATSSIDTMTEIRVQEAFAQLMKGRTSFVVAHRLSTVQSADVILVMRDGRIIEMGRHEELLAKGGFYAKLYESQFAV